MSVLVPSVVALLAGLTALHAGYRPLRQRMAWRVVGAGCVLWALLGGFEAARLGTDATAPRELVHAGPFIIAVAGLAAALLVIVSQTVDRDTGLDCLLMGVVLFGGAMEFLVYPLRDGSTWTAAGQIALGMVAPVGAIGFVRARRRQDHLLLAALIAVCLAPAFVAARSVDEQSMDRWSVIPADAIFGLGWTVGFLLLGVGALYAARDLNDPVVTNFREHPRGRRIVSIPSVSIVLQLFIVHHTSVEPGVNVVVAGSMMVVTILIAVRLNAASRLVERLAERTLERNRLHTVVESSAAIVGAPDVSSLLRHVGDATARALNRDCVEVVYRPSFGAGQVVLIGTEASSERCAEALHQLIDERPSHHEPFVIHVAARELPADLATRWREAGKWTVLVIPMISEQELFGHVQVWTPFDRTDFPPEAVKTATTVVQEGSLAIQNARLLDVTRQRGNERALLLRVSQAAASSLDLPVVLGEIAQATLGVNAIESTSIELWDPSTEELIVGAQETIPEWPGVHPPGTRFSVDRWPMNRDALMGRDPVPFSVTTPELGPEAQQQMRLIGVGSGVLYPLLAGDERLGLLKVFSRSEDAFGPDDIRLGAEMSNQTALAIQNARLLEDERRRAEERAVLLRVSKAATSSLDLDTVLGEIADSTLGYGGIECTGIELWDRETNELIVGAQRTIPEWPGVDPPGKRYPVGFSEHEGRILNSRDSFTFNLSDPELGETRRNRMIASGTGSALIYPLWIGDQCLGMLDFFSRKERAFTAATQRLGAEIAAQTALAIHNARLLGAEQQRANEWAVLHRVSRAATSSLDRVTVITEIAQAAIGIPGVEACTIALRDVSGHMQIVADESVPDWPGALGVGERYPDQVEGICSAIIASRRPHIVNADDVDADPILVAEMASFGTRSLVAIPITRQNEEVGLIYLTSRQTRALGSSAARLGQEIAAQAALALYNARLLEAERERASEWAILHRVSRAAITGLDRRTVLADIAQACLGIAGTECCTIFSWDRQHEEIVVEADVTIPEWPGSDEPGTRYPLTPDAAEYRAMRQRAPIVVTSDDPDLVEADREAMREFGYESLVIIPVWISSEATGIIYLSSRNVNAFDENAIRIGAEIAAQTALAIRNAQLLDETRRYADEQSALLRVSRAVSSGRDLVEVMNEVALASLAIAGAECCEIELHLPGTSETQVVAGQHVPGWMRGHTEMGKRLSLDEWPSTREIMALQQPRVLDFDTTELTDYERSMLFDSEQESALIVPMAVEGRCVGVMSCYARARHAFTAESMRLGIDLAGQAAIAIERSRMQLALEEQANTDGLTNLLNHRALQERLDEELARAYRDDSTVAVLMVDLNRFKYVNDTYGHQTGDIVLRSVAATLKASVRAYDIVGRYGGDEFMVILPATDAVEAVIVADRIVEHAAATEIRISHRQTMTLNLSVGLAVFPNQASTRQELIDAADRAMYATKMRRRHSASTGPLLLPTLTG